MMCYFYAITYKLYTSIYVVVVQSDANDSDCRYHFRELIVKKDNEENHEIRTTN